MSCFPAEIESLKQAAIEKEKMTGSLYRDMIQYTKAVLGDIKRYYPDYDEAAGHELAGFVWFQGYDDYGNGGTYPMAEHFIKTLRQISRMITDGALPLSSNTSMIFFLQLHPYSSLSVSIRAIRG